MRKKIITLAAIIIALLAGIMPFHKGNAFAAENIANGKCGENLTWVLTDEGYLTISGTGDMDGEASSQWKDFTDKITRVVINSGVASISPEAFTHCNYTDVFIPLSVKHIGKDAFYKGLTRYYIPDLYYEGTEEDWEEIDIEEGNYGIYRDDNIIYFQADHIHEFIYYESIEPTIYEEGRIGHHYCPVCGLRCINREVPIAISTTVIPKIPVITGNAEIYISEDKFPMSVKYAFIPKSSGAYTFESNNPDIDGLPIIEICDEDGNLLVSNYEYYDDRSRDELEDGIIYFDIDSERVLLNIGMDQLYNFSVSYDFEEGQIYYLSFREEDKWNVIINNLFPYSVIISGDELEEPSTEENSSNLPEKETSKQNENNTDKGSEQPAIPAAGNKPSSPEKISSPEITDLTQQAQGTTRNFPDVQDPSKPYYKPVYWAVNKGITVGYKNGNFGPADSCTRAQFVTFIWRLAGKPTPKDTSNKFSDVNKSMSAFKPIMWAVEKGIIVGYKDGTFRPNAEVTRRQVAVMLWRWQGKPSASKNAPFTDISRSDTAYKAIQWGAEAGVVKGSKANGGQVFKPDDLCQRQQIVTFLYRYARDVLGEKVN